MKCVGDDDDQPRYETCRLATELIFAAITLSTIRRLGRSTVKS
jgi:hypothetical protein